MEQGDVQKILDKLNDIYMEIGDTSGVESACHSILKELKGLREDLRRIDSHLSSIDNNTR